MREAVDNYRSRDYWIVENAQYAGPSFCLRKLARFVDALAGGRRCSLRDVGCGPATLRELLSPNLSYFSLDTAIQQPACYLREVDFVRDEISFGEKRLDFVVGLGLF